MDPYTVIEHPLSTEKSIRLMESENKLVFAVNKKATKTDVKKAAERTGITRECDVKKTVENILGIIKEKT